MSTVSWFWLTVIVYIITIGTKDILCVYWRYKYDFTEKKKRKVNDFTPRHVIKGFSK